MNDLKESDKLVLEKLFEMRGGSVLNFTNSSFKQFIFSLFSIDIYGEKYSLYGDSKAKRLRSFWQLENNEVIGKLIIELSESWNTNKILSEITVSENDKDIYKKALSIASKLLGSTLKKSDLNGDVDEFLQKEFDNISLQKLAIDVEIIDILNLRINEIRKSIISESPLTCIILCGSVLEGILFGVASTNMEKFNKCEASPRNKISNKPLPFNKWTLSNFIDVSFKLQLIDLDVMKYSHALRDFRNYIHPYQQKVSKFNPDIETAKISWQVLKAAISDLTRNL
jgi:hypothetical protein